VVDGVDLAHVRKRLRLLARPDVTVTPPPEGVLFDHDVRVRVRDGTELQVNVFRPEHDDGPRPVILSAHPYGKDALPHPRRRGGYRLPFQFRMLPQSRPFTISAWTSWGHPTRDGGCRAATRS
jgi:predicted acyl esterase